ncbi:MAG: hypothetical protein H6Q61_849 [Firmicutes bacterium]|nr:hypothetical protein [Bacillota bacterium]
MHIVLSALFVIAFIVFGTFWDRYKKQTESPTIRGFIKEKLGRFGDSIVAQSFFAALDKDEEEEAETETTVADPETDRTEH